MGLAGPVGLAGRWVWRAGGQVGRLTGISLVRCHLLDLPHLLTHLAYPTHLAHLAYPTHETYPTSAAMYDLAARRRSMRLSRDWWAVLAAALAILLIKTGVVAGVPW